VTERLTPYDITISRLAHGVPVGGELDFLDDGTLATALKSRQTL
jgi:recombination protein RecR